MQTLKLLLIANFEESLQSFCFDIEIAIGFAYNTYICKNVMPQKNVIISSDNRSPIKCEIANYVMHYVWKRKSESILLQIVHKLPVYFLLIISVQCRLIKLI